ncbi:response regulator [Chloroflexota bacterium]
MSDKASVLVVDDNEDLLNTFSLILKRRGFNVDTAENGASAVDKYKGRHFDVTLMDIVMPEMNGVEALKKIREINPGARVILMTAYSEDELMSMALEEGARGVIHKPIKIDRMIELIKETALNRLVLVVDDDEDICQTMSKTLEMDGYQVIAANSGEEAVKIARERPLQIAFIDIKLPLMNGLETYLKLKKLNPGITTIMMTGYREEVEDMVDKALSASAATCLYKPFDPTDALGLVTRLGGKTV